MAPLQLVSSKLGPIWRKMNLAEDIVYAKASRENKLGFSLVPQVDWLDHSEQRINDWTGSRGGAKDHGCIWV